MSDHTHPKVLIIEKGFGGKVGKKYETLQKTFPISMPIVPEPTDNLEAGVEILKKEIIEFVPDVLIASSRGGKYAAQLISDQVWKGPTLFISGMSTSTAITPGVPMIIAHGTRDGTNPIDRVRGDVQYGTKGLLKLVEFDDDHHLAAIEQEGVLEGLVWEVYHLKDKIEECLKNDPPIQKKPAPRNALFAELTKKKK